MYRLLKVKDFSTKSTSIWEVKIDFLNAWLGAVESSGQQLLSIVHSILSISFSRPTLMSVPLMERAQITICLDVSDVSQLHPFLHNSHASLLLHRLLML